VDEVAWLIMRLENSPSPSPKPSLNPIPIPA
jgi:hypothetical protein